MGPTEIGGKYNDGPAGIHNKGEGWISVDDSGIVIGRLDYPGPQSGGLSSQRGDCSAIIAQMPWIVGSVPVDNSALLPKGVIGPDGNMVSAGYLDLPGGAKWLVACVGGVPTYGDAPGAVSQKAAAQKALAVALDTAQAAAAILAAQK